jgi:hypothetical protein
MKRFIVKLIWFLSLACVAYTFFSFFIFPPILRSVYGPTVKEQIDRSFQNASRRNYQLVVLGNSRLYCGVNPDKFEYTAFNFAHNNDTYNQIYYKLSWILERNKELQYVILGVDYFQFSILSDSRNYAYGRHLGQDYLRDYPAYHYLYSYVRETLHPYKLKTLIRDPIFKHDLKDNGQFIRRGVPKDEDFIKRNFSRLDIQIRYFEKILQTCEQNNIRVFLCLPPMRIEEIRQSSSEQIQDFNSFIAKYTKDGVRYLDFSRDSRFNKNDFIDYAHLSLAAADRFTAMLNDSIKAQTAVAGQLVRVGLQHQTVD